MEHPIDYHEFRKKKSDKLEPDPGRQGGLSLIHIQMCIRDRLDLWAVHALNELIQKVDAGYNSFDFHVVYHAIHNFCVVDMSNFYLDIIKDRLYCEGVDSFERRSAQSAIYMILNALTRLVAPILAFTSEEIWAAMPHFAADDAESVLFNAVSYTHLDVYKRQEPCL